MDHSGHREKEVASGNLKAPLGTLPKTDSSGWACQTHPTRGHPRLTQQGPGGYLALGRQHWQEGPCEVSPPECQRRRGPWRPSGLIPSLTVQDAEAQGLVQGCTARKWQIKPKLTFVQAVLFPLSGPSHLSPCFLMLTLGKASHGVRGWRPSVFR